MVHQMPEASKRNSRWLSAATPPDHTPQTKASRRDARSTSTALHRNHIDAMSQHPSAWHPFGMHRVFASDPVVSLRSTTGYLLGTLRVLAYAPPIEQTIAESIGNWTFDDDNHFSANFCESKQRLPHSDGLTRSVSPLSMISTTSPIKSTDSSAPHLSLSLNGIGKSFPLF